MKFSEQWLRQWVQPDLSSGELAHLLTMAGLEVGTVTPAAEDFSGVVVGEITAAQPHPEADKLRVCQVSTGTETLQIVCGAANARVGLRAPLAQVGAVLAGGTRIKPVRLRGVESRGMLCAEAELGLSTAAAGLMELAADAPLGEDLRSYLALDDQVFDLDLTPNRADCLGIRGIAREVGALTGCAVGNPEWEPVPETLSAARAVTLENPEACPRYLGRVIKGVDNSRPTPLWMQERLRRSGQRCVDAVVDVTNYVMLELGQPMHAFDLNHLREEIVVRTAEEREELTLLDGRQLTLNAGSLLITDADGPLALAGIMGGARCTVNETTTDVMLESAFFHPRALAGQARSYGLATESCHRFERGVDYNLQRHALERASQLLSEIAGGAVGPITEALASDHLPVTKTVALRRERIPRLLGFELEDAAVERILEDLGLTLTTDSSGWRAEVPSWRFDLAIEADLLEELARISGYENIPVLRPGATLRIRPKREQSLSLRALRRCLAARDYREAVTYSFVDPGGQALFDPETPPLPVQNPISSELSVMRSSLLPGLMNAVRHNVNRQRSRVRLFETGLRFLPGADGLQQRPTLAAVLTGRRWPESWTESGEQVDFYDAKGDLEALLALTAEPATFRFVAAQRPAFHPGQTAALWRGDEMVGHVGALHPSCLTHYDLDTPVLAFEVDLEVLCERALPEFRIPSRFPGIRRDLAVLVQKSVAVAELLEGVRQVAGSELTGLMLFDVYEGEGIDPKRKSLAFGLTFGDASRTLEDRDVSANMDRVIEFLKQTYHAELRE